MKRNKFNVGLSCALAAGSLFMLTSCDLDDDSNGNIQPVAYVTLYNASPDAPELKVEVDNRQINAYPLEYSDNTGYLRFYTGDRNLKFGPFGASSVAIDSTLTLEDGNAYSIFVADNFSQAGLVVLNDNGDAPVTGKVKVRFVNLSPDTQGANLLVKGDTTLVEEMAFKNGSGWIEIDAGSYDLAVTTDATQLDVPDVNLAQGQFYTVLVRGYQSPPSGSTRVLSAEVLQN